MQLSASAAHVTSVFVSEQNEPAPASQPVGRGAHAHAAAGAVPAQTLRPPQSTSAPHVEHPPTAVQVCTP
jgi:hypothetical protein